MATSMVSRATTDLGGRTEEGEAAWQGYRATLLELAEAAGEAPALAQQRRRRAGDVLLSLDDLLTEELLDSRRRCWRWVGRSLVAAGHERLWAALYAAGELAEGAEYLPGEEGDFLERDDLPVPPLPAHWPGRWASPSEAPGASAGNGGQTPQYAVLEELDRALERVGQALQEARTIALRVFPPTPEEVTTGLLETPA